MVHIDIPVKAFIRPARPGTSEILARDRACDQLFLVRHIDKTPTIDDNSTFLHSICHSTHPGIAYVVFIRQILILASASGVAYTIALGVGQPPTQLTFMIDGG